MHENARAERAVLSHAEAYRLVTEALEQRTRAEQAEIEVERLREQLQQWEEFDFERDNPKRLVEHVLALMVERDTVNEELAETRAHEHVLVIVGDMLCRRLEWMIEEPTSGLDAEILDVIKERSAKDVDQWLTAIHNAGFKRPDERETDE